MKPDDSRHGTANGYDNLGCRCQPCTDAWTTYLRTRQRTINCGDGIYVSVPLPLYDRFRAFADARGASLRSLAMQAIEDLMANA